MVRTSRAGDRRRRDAPLSWPLPAAIGLAFGGFYIAVAGFSAGLIAVGIAGLLALGLALGFTGRLGSRIGVAIALWLAVTLLTGLSVAFGEVGFMVIVPVIFCLLCVALGQGIGMVSGALLRRSEPAAERQTSPEGARGDARD